MTSNVRGPVLLVAALVAGLQAGTYFTWATGVMPGLARVDDRTFVHAMQQMNVAIVNPVFIATFLGARCWPGPSIAVAGSQARPWAIAATVLAVGTLVDHLRRQHPAQRRPRRGRPGRQDQGPRRRPRRLRVALGRLNVARSLTSAGAWAALAMAALQARG